SLDARRVPVDAIAVAHWCPDAIPHRTSLTIPDASGATLSGMREWSEVADAVAATRSTSAKVATVARYLRELPDEELEAAVTFLSGRPFPGADDRTTGAGWRPVTEAVRTLADEAAARTGRTPMGLGEAYDRSSDIGTAVMDALASAGHEATGDPPGV